MAHDIDITEGQASFASARVHAWHKLGQVLPEGMTAETALAAANLANWNVRKEPLYVHPNPDLGVDGVTSPDPVLIDGRFATVRTNPITQAVDPLGVVGPNYTVIQNEEHADLLNTLVDESGAHFETAGALQGGRQIFLSMKLPKAIAIRGHDGEDVTETYLVAVNSHDGSSAFKLMVTPVRVVCANTLSAALGNMRSSFSIRHTSGANRNIQQAREALGVTWKYMDALADAAELQVNRTVDLGTARIELKKVFGFTDKGITERQLNSQTQRIEDVVALWDQAPTNANLRGTAYGLYNAVAEYIDHYQPVRGGADKEELRAVRVTRGDASLYKEKAFSRMNTLAMA